MLGLDMMIVMPLIALLVMPLISFIGCAVIATVITHSLT